MSISLFETRTLLEVLAQLKSPQSFFTDHFFSGADDISLSSNIDIDIIKGKRKLAPFVNPNLPGKLMEKRGYTTSSFKPAYVKPKFSLTASDFESRDAGSNVYSPTNAYGQRAIKKIGELLAELDEMVVRRIEWMISTALQTGKIPIIGDGVNAEIDLLMEATHLPILTSSDVWSDLTTSKPLYDLEEWATIILQDAGLAVDTVIMGISASRNFMANADVKELLNNRRIQMAEIKPEMLAPGIRYMGNIASIGDFYTYNEWYVDEDTGDEANMMDTDKVLLGSTQARCVKKFGAIQDLDCMQAVAKFPKVYSNEDKSARFITIQSAPLPLPVQIDGFLCATVQ